MEELFFKKGVVKVREWLKKLRKNRGITQQKIAEALEIAASSYSMIETGQRQSKMTIEFAQKLAHVLDVPIEYILEHENKNGQGV